MVFVLLFGETAKRLLSVMIWVEGTRDRVCVVLDNYGVSFIT